ncbi:MAG: folate-binding protein [Betaproteobacteria bacterium]|nr:MAG: folate-binding protein [Betaproteobacteria bacterium]
MTPAWHTFLDTQGAQIDAAGAVSFPPSATAGPLLADLSHFGLIAFSGEETLTFLQGQITNDLRDQGLDQAVFAGYCNAKGRLYANFLVLRREADTLVLLPASLREILQKRLSMFIMRSKTRARDADAEWVRLGLAGAGARAVLTRLWGAAPAAGLAVLQHADGLAIGLADDRFDLLVRPDAAPALWQALRAEATPIGHAAWDAALVSAGIPTITPATVEAFTPQMVNMELLHGVSFTKGCYPGQEVVARTQWLGKVKRRMFLAHSAAEVAPGTHLFSAAVLGQDCGQIVNVAAAASGGYDYLAVVRLDAWKAADVRLAARDGVALTALPQPYSLPE